MSLFDKMMERNTKRLKKMQEQMLDMQEEVFDEHGAQIARVNQKSAELSAGGTRVHYEAVASGLKNGLANSPEKFCHACGSKIAASANYCSVCGAKQSA